jgi:hypothetical protein
MQIIGLLFIITSIVSLIFMMIANVTSHLLFKTLKKRYTSYYKSIGEPDSLIFSKLSDTEEDFVRNNIRVMKSGWYTWRLVIKGIPKDFPKGVRLRNLMRLVRIISTVTFVLWFTAVILGYFFYLSTK